MTAIILVSVLLVKCKLIGIFHAAFKRAPFRIQEKGWGEFDMVITLTGVEKGGEHHIAHDLNFQNEHYETEHSVVSCFHLRNLA